MKNLLRDFLNRVRRTLRGRQFAEAEIGRAVTPNHLQRPVFARQERHAQRLLSFDHLLHCPHTILGRESAAHLEETADVVRHVRDRHGRRLPQLALWKGERLEADLSAFQTLLQQRAFIAGHGFGRTRSRHPADRDLQPSRHRADGQRPRQTAHPNRRHQPLRPQLERRPCLPYGWR